MDSFERSKWCLWTISLLTQSLFLVSLQVFDDGSSIIWASGSSALVCVSALIGLACFEQFESTARYFWNLFSVVAVPAVGLALLYLDDVTWTVPAAGFEALCAGLMACWAIFDTMVLKPAPDTVFFEDIVADANRNAGLH